MIKWYQRVPGYVLFVVITLQAFDLVRSGMNFAMFFGVTMLMLIGMMTLSAPASSRKAARRLLLIASIGPALLFAGHLTRVISKGIDIGLADVPGLLLLFAPSVALLAYVLAMTKPQES